MPYSFPGLAEAVAGVVRARVPDRATRIIDMGAGAGAIGRCLRSDFPVVDAIEAWEPYVGRFGLSAIYRRVMVMRAEQLPVEDIPGTVFVIGDMLEHLELADAQRLVGRLVEHGARLVVVAVPWLYEQGADHSDVVALGNPFEIHRQPDLTEAVMAERYPALSLVAGNSRCGIYACEGRPARGAGAGRDDGTARSMHVLYVNPDRGRERLRARLPRRPLRVPFGTWLAREARHGRLVPCVAFPFPTTVRIAPGGDPECIFRRLAWMHADANDVEACLAPRFAAPDPARDAFALLLAALLHPAAVNR